jgi:transcriptional regulator of arginine metabolism
MTKQSLARNILLEELKKLLLEGSVSTQEDIKQYLTKLGFEVNQAKISRLLRKVGAVKTSNEYGQIVYCIPKEPAPPQAKSLLGSLIIDIQYNESVIVIHTSPGSASLFARLIDHNLLKLNVLGTVAGDDTIIVIPRNIKQIKKALADIKNLLAQINA